MTIQQYLLKSFTQNSENIAIIHDGISLSYEELYASALKIASVLSEKKLEQASIALIYENKLQLVIAMLGIILSRNTFVPIPCKTPLARIKQILQISGTQLILSDQESILDTGVEGFNSLKVLCDFKLPDYTPKIGTVDDLSHIYFTSGSTGEPKGIKGRNGSLLSFMLWMIKEFEIGKQDRVMQIAGEGFSLFKREVLATLISGATLVIPTEGDKSSFDSIAKFIALNEITLFNIVPSYYNYLVDYLSSAKHPKLRLIFIAGEILYKSLVNKHIHAFNNHCRLINLYGPTETTQAKFYYEIDFNNYQFAEMMPVGLPINDVTTAYIRDESGILVAASDIIGEIIIATDDISYGYCNISQNKSFIEINGKKAFCSGDLGYKDQAGLLHVLGRADSQIKIRGMRVELSEIEAHVLNVDGIREVAVLYVLPSNSHGGQLVAALVGDVAKEDVLQYLTSRVPDYMLPVKFIYLDNLPKNRNNKIDRLALSKIIQEHSSVTNSVVAKENGAITDEITTKLLKIWQGYFSQPFSIHDDFFALGGSSLLIMAIASKINVVFNLTPAFNVFYEKRTIAELAQYIHANQYYQNQPRKSALIQREYSNAYFPLTHIQQAYLLGRFGNYKLGGIATQRYVEYSYSQHLDYARLEIAINQLIKRHAMLRTTFSVDKMVQITHPEYRYQLTVNDYSTYSETEFQIALIKIRTEMLAKKLDVTKLPLFEINISRGVNGDRLHFLSDILIMDAHSLNIFREELTALYNACNLPEQAVTFRDYIESKAESASGFSYPGKFYWFHRFKDIPNIAPIRTLQLPESVTNPVFARDSRVISASVWQEFKNKAYQNSLSPTSALLTIYYSVLARYSTNPNFLINISLFDKTNSSVADNNIIGDFTDILAFSPYVGNERQFINQVRLNHSLLWKDLEHRAIDGIEVFSIIRQKFNLDSDTIIAPLVFTSLLEDSKTNTFLENNAQEEFYLSQTAQVWLDNNAIESNGSLLSGWDYVSQLFAAEYIESLHTQYVNLIEYFALNAWDNEMPDIADPNDLAIVATANSSYQSLDRIITLKEQALAAPHSIAVIDANGSYSYAKLMEKSYSIASLLKKHGIQQRELVAIFSEKGYQQVAAAWGIMKTGAAYLPLNIDWPIGRIEEVLQEGMVRYILVAKNQLAKISVDTIKLAYQILVIEDANDLETDVAAIPMAELDEAAYVLFTSGSTGKPKGVVISYLGVINTLKAINQRFNINQDDAVLALSELSFDLSVYDMFGMLGAGGKVVFPDSDKVKEPSYWYELIVKHQITIWNTVPQIMQLLIDYVISQKKPLDSLRVVLLSGDWIPLNLPKQIKSLNPNITVMSLGGATEGSIWSCWYEIDKIDVTWKSIPYGVAMPNQKMYILDSQGRHCPTNVIGEIYIGGIGVAIGYWNDSDKTTVSFIQHEVLGRLYKTGDLGCWNKAGYIEFHGRKDFQVKINGYRIELEEITAKLNKINGIDSSIVQVYPNAGRDYIIAYLLSRHNYLASDSSELQAFKLKLTGVRNDLPVASYKLNLELPENKFILRKSYRRYLPIDTHDDLTIDDILQSGTETIKQWINLNQPESAQGLITTKFLDELFAAISAINLEQRILPKYRYPSAGSSYAVRTYLDVPNALGDYQSGYYYYNPLAKTLTNVESSDLSKNLTELVAIDLIVHWPAIAPLYQDESSRFVYLEAGHMLALILEVVFKYNIPVTIEVLDKVIDVDNMQLIRLIFGKSEATNLNPLTKLNKLIKKDSGVYANAKHQIHINKQDIFTRANWYSGRLLETGSMLLSFDGDRSPENLIYAGMYFQLVSELLYQHNIGSCMLGYDIYENVLYSMVLGVIDESEKHKSESMPEDKAVGKYIEESLIHQLPEYMLPYEYVFVDKLPLTANGKVDLKELPAPQFSSQGRIYIAPDTPLEQEVCQIFARELGVKAETIGVEDDFFRIGGNSILAIRLTSHLNNSFDSNLKVSDIFVLKTVRQLANLIRTTLGDFIFKDYQIKANEENNLYLPFSLNNVQHAYYLGRYASFELGNISTHSYSEHKFNQLDLKRLESALNHTIKRHPGLRAIFKDGQQQYLAEVPSYTLKCFEFTNCEDFYQLRESLSHKIYMTEAYPLFDFIVSRCLFSGEEPYYILHISFDILLMDGNSARLLYDELTNLYHHPDLQLPMLSVNYRDYILQMEKIRASDLFVKDREYWLNKLPEYNFDLQLPLSCRATDIEKPRFNKLTKVITNELWDKIKTKALKYDVGLTSIILVIYGKILSYWSNQTSLCINLTLFNRIPLHPQINEILGDFTVLELFNYKNPGRVGQKSIIDEIKTNHEQLWQDIEHNLFDGIDFQRLIREEKQLPTNQIIAPVVLTSVLGASKDKEQFLDDSYLGKEYSINQTSQVWLVNHAHTSADGFIAEWNYVEQLFNHATISAMHEDYCNLIEFLAEANWDKDVFPEPDSANLALIKQINSAKQPVSENNLCDSLQSVMETYQLAEHPALIDNSSHTARSFSYPEVLSKSQLLARQIIEVSGLNQVDTLIGILAEKGANQVIASLGIMFAGYAYLPLNVAWPIERIDEVLTGGEVNLLLISRRMLTRFNQNLILQKYQLIIIEDIVLEPTHEMQARLAKIALPVVKPDDIAYVIFTSGSTGKPKGVTISHRGALNTINAVNATYHINQDDKVLALSDLSFDLSVYDIFGMLAVGGTIVFPNPDKVKEPNHWQQLINEHKITIWNSVPQLAELLIEDWQPLQDSTIRLILLSGDWIPVTLPKRLSEACPLSTIVSLGGATEGSIWSIWHQIDQVNSSWSSIPYGVAMPNQQIYVLNHSLHNCPDGVIGEIYIGGDGVALSYYHDDEKTSAAFINHPELGRLYKTGDSGKLNPEGYIEFMGRLDNQVKLNGYRVELSEISAKLLQLDGVEDALVQLSKIAGKGYLIAYLVLENNFAFSDSQELARRFNLSLQNVLPEYMLPHLYITLEELPLTANGKVDLHKLPVPAMITEKNDFYKPENELETNILEIYSEVLQKNSEEISTRDSFFRLGGDSIVAIRLISRLNKKLGLKVAVRDIFTYRSISELAAYIAGNNLQNETQDCYIPFSLINRADYTWLGEFDQFEDIFPASYLQLGMLFESMNSQYSTYHVVITQKYAAGFDQIKFQRIWDSLIQKHELLRARFILSENSYDCLIYKNMQFNYTIYYDCSLSDLINTESQLDFNYSKAGLFRVLVNQYNDKDEFDMIISFHHAITDGWSISRLINEFSAAYLFAKPVEAKQVQLSYGAFIRQEQQHIKDAKMITFWQKYLAEVVVPAINWSGIKSESNTGLNQSRLILEMEISQKIQSYAHKLNVSSDCVFLFIYLSVLARFLNQKDLTIGLVVNNRLEIAGGDDLFGLFLNTIPYRYNLDSQNIDLLIKNIYNEKIRLYNYKGFPYAKIKESFTHDLYQFMFNYTHFQINRDGKISSTEANDYQRSNIPFVLNVAQGDYFILDLIAHDSFCSKEYLDYFAKNIQQGIIYLIEYGKHPAILPEDYAQQISSVSDNNYAYGLTRTLPELFSQQVVKTPDEIALIYNNQHFTYRELEQKTNQLAHYLLEKYTLKPDDLVIVYMERSEFIVIALLAVMKAGAAFVPVDPDYPESRIKFILEDTNAKVILTLKNNSQQLSAILNQYNADKIQQKMEMLLVDQVGNFTTYPASLPQTASGINNLAYVIYTSGTTGQPKGVMIEHQSVFNLVQNMLNLHQLSENKVATIYSNYVFDAFVCELFPPLIAGNQVILLSNEERLSLDLLAEKIIKHNVNLAFIPSVLVNDFLQLINDRASKLKMIFAGGDRLADINFDKLAQDLIIVNEYGPTEATVCSTLKYLSSNDIVSNIGKPLHNVGVYILNEELQLLPLGAVGELYISGDGLARGYLNQPELTSAKFIPNPYQTGGDKKQGKHARLYKTGDLAKYLPDGSLIFIGRNDSQIKINGHRIELSEIENTLIRTCKNIRQSIAITKNNNQQVSKIIVYFIADNFIDTKKLHTTLGNYLPDYMLPQIFIQLDEFPLNINGKIDYKLLPKPELMDIANGYVAPSSEIEKQLCLIFGELLQLDGKKIGVNDDFFILGGNSILTIRLVARLNKKFKINLKIADILANSSLDKLAQLIINSNSETGYRSLIKLNSSVNKPNMFMIHPGQAGCEVYAKLAKELENYYSCYGVENYNLHHQEKITDFNQLVVTYLDFIISQGYLIDKKTQVTLFGWSLGGLIALEIAAILEQLGYLNIRIYLLDTIVFDEQLRFYQSRAVNQKYQLRDFLVSQSYDSDYISKIFENYDTEISLAQSPISNNLKYTKIVLFKAMQVGSQFDGDINIDMTRYILNLTTNNIECCLSDLAQLSVLNLNHAHHWNILEQKEIFDFITGS